MAGPASALAEALTAAATGAPRRYVITGGPSSGQDDLIDAILAAGINVDTKINESPHLGTNLVQTAAFALSKDKTS